MVLSALAPRALARSRVRVAAVLVVAAAALVARGAQAEEEEPPSDETEAAAEAKAADAKAAEAKAAEAKAAEQNAKAAEQNANIEQKAQNPLSDLIRVNFQNNLNFDAGPERRTQNVLNIQSTLRMWLGKDWLILNRSQVPIISQPLPPGQRTVGLGDILLTFFVSPRELAGPFIWGVGPTVTLPTATDVVLGAGKWALGPSPR